MKSGSVSRPFNDGTGPLFPIFTTHQRPTAQDFDNAAAAIPAQNNVQAWLVGESRRVDFDELTPANTLTPPSNTGVWRLAKQSFLLTEACQEIKLKIIW